MSIVKADIEIAAPIEKVWETVMDPNRLADWVTIHKSVKHVSDSPLRRGSTMEQAMHVRGFTFHVTWTVVSMSAPNSAEWKGAGPAHSQASIHYELTSLEEGRTRFHYTNEFKTPGGKLGAVASRVIVGATSQREAHRSLTKLKTLLESA
jgi:carbon monoxide dehydrogenase subunit G